MLTDPPGASVIGDAVGWLEGAALGTIATIIAVIAVAAVGLAMLGGRISLRRGVSVVLGCFLILGARTFAVAFAAPNGAESSGTAVALSDPLPTTVPAPQPPAYDPYAGASVPVTR